MNRTLKKILGSALIVAGLIGALGGTAMAAAPGSFKGQGGDSSGKSLTDYGWYDKWNSVGSCAQPGWCV